MTVPSAPSPIDLIRETTTCVLIVRQSNDTLNSDDFLDAGTPPPSYAEVLACISNPAINESEENSPIQGNTNHFIPGLSSLSLMYFIFMYLDENSSGIATQTRNSLHPNDCSPAEMAIQRFSLQLALDCSDTSSCTSTSSRAQPLSTSSSSSAASIAHLGSN